MAIKIQEKIFSYHSGLIRIATSIIWNEPLVALTFNTNEKVAKYATRFLSTLTSTSKTGRKLQPVNIQKAVELFSDKLKFLSLQDEILEQGKEVLVNEKLGLKLTKTNCTAYLESLVRGLSGVCEGALTTNYFSENPSVALALCATVQKFGTSIKDKKVSSKFFDMAIRILRYTDLSGYDPLLLEASLGGGKIFTRATEKFKDFESKNDKLELPRYTKISEFCKETLKISSVQISHKNVHWKSKILSLLIALKFSRLTDPKTEEFEAFYRASITILTDDHYYLRMIGIGAISVLLKMRAKAQNQNQIVYLEERDFENKQISIEEFLYNHFNRAEDLQFAKNINSFTGYLDIYNSYKRAPEINYEIDATDHFAKWLLDENHFQVLLSTIVNDISAKELDAAQNRLRSNIGTKSEYSPEVLLNMVFVKSTKQGMKNANTPVSFNLLIARFFKKIFTAFGPKMFKQSIAFIESFAQDFNSKEKQGIVTHYLGGLIRGSRFWDRKSRNDTQLQAAHIIRKCIEQVSVEIFANWILAINYMTKKFEASQLDVFLDALFTNPFELKVTPNIQGRYLTIYLCFFGNQGYQLRQQAFKLFEFIKEVSPKDKRQATEIAQTIIITLTNVFLSPIDKEKLIQLKYVKDADKLDELEIKDVKLVKSGRYYYEVNCQIVKLIDDLVARGNNGDKATFYLAVTLALGLQGARLKSVYYTYFKPVVQYMIEFNPEDNEKLDQDCITTFKKYATSISKSFYPSKILADLLNLNEKAYESQNHRQREHTIMNLQFIRFNHTFNLTSLTDIYPIDQALIDDKINVRNAAFEGLKDLFKILTKNEITQVIESAKKIVSSKDADEKLKSKALITLMSLILAFPYEVEEWMEDPLRLIVKHKNLTNLVKERVKDFISKFWKTQKGSKHINRCELPIDLYDSIREISNPYTYFA